MTDTTNRLSLWQAMDNGMDAQANKEVGQTDPLVWRRIRAAEIRAVAEWIEKRQVEDYAVTLPDVREVIRWLTTEADRAEMGDHG